MSNVDYNIKDLNDVFGAPSTDDVLVFNGGTWVPQAPTPNGFVAISTQAVNFAPADKNFYLVDVSGGAININLPAPSSGFTFTFKILGDAFTNNVTVVRNGTENIETVAANFVINNQLGAYNLISDGTDWYFY
jgi:hypothetical protein